MRKKTLLLGNGLNRTLEGSLSWSTLMELLGGRKIDSSLVPFPIQFEQIAAERGVSIGRRRTDPYNELRKDLKRIVENSESQPGEAHLAFRNIAMDHVITTNYDLVFESMYGCKLLITKPSSYKNYLTAVYKTQSIDFFHAHGVVKWQRTMCLSHEHYISLISKIRREFFKSESDENEEIFTGIVRQQKGATGTWPELLFTTDVAIVGLGLDFSEIDLWWLLAQRAAVFAPCHELTSRENRIVYYYIDKEGEREGNPQRESKLAALQALGVEPVAIPSTSYLEGYKQIARKLAEEWGTR